MYKEGQWVRITAEPVEQKANIKELYTGRLGIIYSTNIYLPHDDRTHLGVEFDPYRSMDPRSRWAFFEYGAVEHTVPTPEEVVEWFIMWNDPGAKER